VITTNSIAKCEKPIAFAIVLLLDLSDEKYEKSPFAYIIFKIRIFNKYLHVTFLKKRDQNIGKLVIKFVWKSLPKAL
jgi:hypothetical protein